ncbi:MAG: C40 family peptidase [Neisseria sp.]|nr:C40 family peptidase [Neisseria sp.]
MNLVKKFICTLAILFSVPASMADDLENLIQSRNTIAPSAPATTQSVSKQDADDLIRSAMGLLGVAYRFGGTSPTSGMDCSGFMQYIFRKSMQVNLPRTAAQQAQMGVAVSRSELQAGDMVFFNTAGNRISHVGLYIGNNRFIHAPRTGKTIEITSLSNKYWNSKYRLARRVKPYNSGRFTN